MEATLPRHKVTEPRGFEAIDPPTVEIPVAPTPRGWRALARWPLAVFALTRLLYSAMTYGAIFLLHSQVRLQGIALNQLLVSWQRWDVRWFQAVAAHGYTQTKDAAFFPLMPLLMKLVALPLTPLMGNAAYYVAGILVANGAFLGALILLQALVEREYDAATGQRAVLYLALYPKALFTFTAYSEGLFLLLAIGCVLLLRRGRFGWAGALAALATLDRLAGLALVFAISIELAQRYRWQIGAWLTRGWSLLLAPLAIIAYMGVLSATLGDPLAFSHAETQWGRAGQFPLVTLVQAGGGLLTLPFGSAHQFNRAFDLAVALLWLGLLGAACLPKVRQRWRIPWSLVGLGLALTLLPLSDPLTGYAPDILSSLSRYLLVAFPVFIILARLTDGRPRCHEILLVTSTAFTALFVVGFVLGYYVV